ncbi:Tubulin polyglutamylase ttll13p [Bulinus truncatus]|nr:Tubulin polyglutamylase ttll13p [Bulinus truncatus]
MEASNDGTKQEKSENCGDVTLIKDETIAHVSLKQSPGTQHGRLQIQTTQLKDLLTCSCDESNGLCHDASGLPVNHCNYEIKLSEACRAIFSNKNDQKSMELDVCEPGTVIDCKPLNSNDRSVHSRSPVVNMDLLLSSLFNISPSALSDKSSINRSHPIIAHILTGEENNLGKEQACVSPDENFAQILKDDIAFSESKFSESPESPDISENEDNDVESFIDGTICKNLMSENIEVSRDWEASERELGTPTKAPEKTTEHRRSLRNGTVSSLLIADVSANCNLKHVITQVSNSVLEFSSIKVVPPAEAVDICNKESFHLIWTCVLSSIQEDFITLSTAIRYSSKKNKNAILIALTDIDEGEVKLKGFDEVCHLPVSKETVRKIHQKYQWTFREDNYNIERTLLSPQSIRTPESTASVESLKTSERSSPVESISPAWCRAEHANKEKQRRERIKDSCDQLRVLLPYVRGRKTDMASILEMTVDYLRIITAALPQDFQSQIINIMSNGSTHLETLGETAARKTNSGQMSQMYSPPVKQPRPKASDKKSSTHILGMSYSEPKSKIRIMTKSLTKSVVSSPVDYKNHGPTGNIASHNESQTNVYCSLKKTVQTNILSDTNSAVHITKREYPPALTECNYNKRPNTITTLTELNQPKSLCLPTSKGVSVTKDVKEKHFETAPQVPNYQAFKIQPKLKDNEITSKQFLTAGHINSDLFQFQQQTQVNTLTSRMGTVDRDMVKYGEMYFDGNYYAYFPSVNEMSSGGFCIPGTPSDYVSPNAVLPMTSHCPGASTFRAAHAIDQAMRIEAGQLRVNQANTTVYNEDYEEYDGEGAEEEGSKVPAGIDDMIKKKKKEKKKKKKKWLTICLSNCKYDVVKRTARKYGFREVSDDDDWTLYWTDFSVALERVMDMKKYQKINHFPGMSEICRKDMLARNMNRMSKLFPKEYGVFPKTWCLPADYGDFQAYTRQKKNKTYILKPESGCQGRGIWVTKYPKDIKPNEHMICQVYITRPFLIDGFKFDLRVYTLVTSCDPLRIFVFKDGLARFATNKYSEPNHNNTDNVYMHLTNYAINKHSQDFVRDDEAGSKRRISTINKYLRENGYDVDKLWSDIDDVIIKTLISAHSVLKHNYRTCFPNHVKGSACFEILGFDIIFDRKLKPIVLEVNHSPSFTTDANIDKEIKGALIWDTLGLVNFGAVDRRKCVEEEKRRIKERLLGKYVKKETKEELEAAFNQYLEQLEKYEEKHLGNFRRIYPSTGTEKYDKFFHSSGTLFQETAAFKARQEMARQQREEIMRKKEKNEMMLKGKAKKDVLRPESPGRRRRKLSNRPTLPLRHLGNQHASSYEDVKEYEPIDTKKPQDIIEEEELERLSGLLQRDNLVRGLGIFEHAYRLLHSSPGILSNTRSDPRGQVSGQGHFHTLVRFFNITFISHYFITS